MIIKMKIMRVKKRVMIFKIGGICRGLIGLGSQNQLYNLKWILIGLIMYLLIDLINLMLFQTKHQIQTRIIINNQNAVILWLIMLR